MKCWRQERASDTLREYRNLNIWMCIISCEWSDECISLADCAVLVIAFVVAGGFFFFAFFPLFLISFCCRFALFNISSVLVLLCFTLFCCFANHNNTSPTQKLYLNFHTNEHSHKIFLFYFNKFFRLRLTCRFSLHYLFFVSVSRFFAASFPLFFFFFFCSSTRILLLWLFDERFQCSALISTIFY